MNTAQRCWTSKQRDVPLPWWYFQWPVLICRRNSLASTSTNHSGIPKWGRLQVSLQWLYARFSFLAHLQIMTEAGFGQVISNRWWRIGSRLRAHIHSIPATGNFRIKGCENLAKAVWRACSAKWFSTGRKNMVNLFSGRNNKYRAPLFSITTDTLLIWLMINASPVKPSRIFLLKKEESSGFRSSAEVPELI